jgi:hypothetical protein
MRTKRSGLVRPEPHILVPDGEYPARLVRVGRFANAHGERLGFSFAIEGGPHAGAVLMQSAACSGSRTGRLATLLRDLLGREPTPAELAAGPGPSHIGLACRIIVLEESTRSGDRYSEVQKVTRA